MKKDWSFIVAVGITAFVLAGTAAFFSIFGLSKLFVGAYLAIIIMAGTLEFAKIVIASYLNQYWGKISVLIKSYLILALVILMAITSVGIYGFLSNAYSKTSIDLKKANENISLVEKRKQIKVEEVGRIDKNIEAKRKRIEDLSGVRKSQETRLDSLYNKGWTFNAKKTENIINRSDNEIVKLTHEIDSLNKVTEKTNKEISEYDLQNMELNNNQIYGEIGPLKYISKITGIEMDSVVNYIMILLMIVFDPLAIVLVIVVNTLIRKRNETNKEEPMKKEKKEGFFKRIFSNKNKKEEVKANEVPVDVWENVEEVPCANEESSGIPKHEIKRVFKIDVGNVSAKDAEKYIKEIQEQIRKSPIPDEQLVLPETGEPLEQKALPESQIEESIVPEEVVIEEQNKDSRHVKLLKILYQNGEKKRGSVIQNFDNFLQEIKQNGFEFTESEIKEFFIICNLLHIVDTNKTNKILLKNYEDALSILKIV